MSKIEDAVKLAKIVSFLKKYKIENTTINDDFTVDVNGSVNISDVRLTEIPIQFRRVNGVFDCSYNNLISLKGSPSVVKGAFYCENNQLTSLEYCPKEVGGYFYCYNNRLNSLKGGPTVVSGYFDCANNNLTNLIGSPEEVGENFRCNYNSDLKSLKGIGVVHGKIYSDFFEGILEDYKGEL